MQRGAQRSRHRLANDRQLVRQAQKVFEPVWQSTKGDDGYVSFELDPLLEDPAVNMPVEERTKQYIDLGKKWAAGHTNRMIKVPATPGGLGRRSRTWLPPGITLNVTLIFSPRQYTTARDAVVARRPAARRSAERRSSRSTASSSAGSTSTPSSTCRSCRRRPRGMVGIVNAKRIWQMNQRFWADKKLPLKQEMIFASTGTKKPEDPPGNTSKPSPAPTSRPIRRRPTTTSKRAAGPSPARSTRCRRQRSWPRSNGRSTCKKMEDTLMYEGIKKFADPQKALLALIADKRKSLGKA